MFNHISDSSLFWGQTVRKFVLKHHTAYCSFMVEGAHILNYIIELFTFFCSMYQFFCVWRFPVLFAQCWHLSLVWLVCIFSSLHIVCFWGWFTSPSARLFNAFIFFLCFLSNTTGLPYFFSPYKLYEFSCS